MGYYEDHILPHVVQLTCGMPAMRKIRRKATVGMSGDIIEIGFGAGNNVGCYPDEVTSVTAIEPSDTAWEMAADAVKSSSVPIRRGGLDGQRLPFDDDVFDAALSTYTMCTIPDLPTALAELRRVVKPGGSLYFLEHGRAPDEKVRRWQRRLEPLQKRLGGGCHLTRDIPALLADAGWEPVNLEQFYATKTPKTFGALSLGVASAA
ncbi:class I SAM-dependent methyltransferase [Gordonia sp. X0973]|uniref:class I SAM-dependent methyltransferase n=1 Tax=Gordonia sp. X0973 TaxID=2742602 RepID=UPI000F51E007|nr:class I SAM-dependent methyltransferase [Gordonia sp. X0973]QKT08377.1 class I SAM-dependent methyltransferase [Gordonia sp. X0973]